MALLTNQRKVCRSRSGGVTFWAWVVSVTVHLVAMAVLGFFKFSWSEAGMEQRSVPEVRISQVKKLLAANDIMPKPKIKRPAKRGYEKESVRLFSVNQIFGMAGPISQGGSNLARPSVPESEITLPSRTSLWEGIDFFGSITNERKICYIVDCSGSMQGMFSRVQKRVRDSIGKLQPDQYFYIIFFGKHRLFEFGDGKMIRATEEVKSAACKFIDSIRPEGKTNAIAAFERAMQIRDSRAGSFTVIYFLTDGFELASESRHGFSHKVAWLLAKFAPGARVNAVGFWPQSEDIEMLQAIAKQSGGEFVLVNDD